VICFFERHGRFIRFESREVADQPGTFELMIVDPDGGERIEQYPDPDLLLQRQRELQRHLTSHGWHGPHGGFV
jgi:hypothetical protein